MKIKSDKGKNSIFIFPEANCGNVAENLQQGEAEAEQQNKEGIVAERAKDRQASMNTGRSEEG